MTNIGTATKAPRAQVAKHEWVDADGKVVKSIEDATGTRYTLLANDERVDMFFDDMPEESRVMAALFGVRTRATNASSSARNANGEDADAQITAVRETWEMICDGEWGEGRTSGVSITLLAEASCLADGKGADEDRVKRVKVWLRGKSDEERVAHAARDQIVVAIARVRAKRAAERATALASKLGTTSGDMGDIPA